MGYPDNVISWEDKEDINDDVHASHVNDLYHEVIAMEPDLINLRNGTDVISIRDRGMGWYLPEWYGNTKLGAMFQADETWSSGGGTQSVDTTNVKLGSQSLRITENDNTAGSLYSTRNNISLDLSKRNNGEVSSDADYIYYPVYISDVTKVNHIMLLFSADATFNNSNRLYVLISSGLITGWNFLKISKSSFISEGTITWSSIQSVRVGWTSLDNAQGAYVSFNLIQLIAKDPLEDKPNPFQRNGVRDYAINSGEWFVGYENQNLVCKLLELNASSQLILQGQQLYTDFNATGFVNNNSSTYLAALSWYISSGNYIAVNVQNDALRLIIAVSGNITTYTTPMPINANDLVQYQITKKGNLVIAKACINNNINTIYQIKATTELLGDGCLGIGGLNKTISTMQYYSGCAITTTEYAAESGHAAIADDVANKWKSWIPTLTWTTATPTIANSKYRYTVIGNTCHFSVYLTTANGLGATDLKISLPVTPKNNGNLVSFSSVQIIGSSTRTNPLACIDTTGTDGIKFYSLSTLTSGQACIIVVSGSYEI